MAELPAKTSRFASSAQESNISIAAFWMMGTVFSFILMMVIVRELTAEMSLFEIMAFRNAIGIAVLTPLVLHHGLHRFRTRRLGQHTIRNIFHFAGGYAWVYGVAVLPLAEVTALEFTTPIWAVLIAAVALSERLSSHRVVAVVFGFLGVLIILRPGLSVISFASMVVLGGALCYAASVVMVKSLTRTEAPWLIVFYMLVLQLPMALIPALFDWSWPSWSNLPLLAIVGVTALTAHYCMARAFLRADAAMVSPMDFLRLPLTALVGWLVYTEGVDVWVLIGAAVIFGSNYYSMWRESREVRP